jgi:hypothetical protein
MPCDHEAPYAALVDRLQSKCAPYIRRPVGRKILGFDAIPIDQQPCMFVVATHQTPVVSGPMSAPWKLGAVIVIYATATDEPESSAETDINNILTQIDAALGLQPNETAFASNNPGQFIQHWTTLGGKVRQATPGPVEMMDGADARQGIAVMHVEMDTAAL